MAPHTVHCASCSHQFSATPVPGERQACPACGATLATPTPKSPRASAPTIDPTPPGMRPTADPEQSQTTDADRSLPERLGRFEVRAFLGAGGFGTVYRAYDPQLDR